MSSKNDISQIKKYLEGSLDSKAMHQLERRALDDPFLQDAIDGYASKKADQQPHLDDLHARLQQRVEQKEARIIPWRTFAIAASILIALTIGGVWLLKREPVKKEIALNVKSIPATAADTTITDHTKTIPDTPLIVANQSDPNNAAAPSPAIVPLSKKTESGAMARPKQAEPKGNASADDIFSGALASTNGNEKKDSSANALSDIIMGEYAKKNKKADSIKQDLYGYNAPTRQQNDSAYLHNLTAKVAGVQINHAVSQASSVKAAHIVNGQVVQGDDKMAEAYATLKKPNGNTDDDIQNSNLNKTRRLKEVTTHNNNDSTDLNAGAGSADLAEVVIVNTGAHPENGWSKFNAYLKTNATTVDGTTGIVKVSFTVAPNGQLSDIKVIGSLSPAADKKAIGLIKNGPNWAGNADQKPQVITLNIQFH